MSHFTTNSEENSDLRVLVVVINGEDVNYLVDMSIVDVDEAVAGLRQCGFTVNVKTVDDMSKDDLDNHFHYAYFMDIGDIISSAVKISEITT